MRRQTLFWVAMVAAVAVGAVTPRTARAEAPTVPLKILEAAEPGGIQLTTTLPAIAYALHVQSLVPTAIKGVTISSTGLTGPDAKLTPIAFEVGEAPAPQKGGQITVDFGAHQLLKVSLSATLAQVGTYSTKIQLFAEGKPLLTPLTIVRSKAVMPVEMLPVAPAKATLGLRGTNAEWRVSFREVTGASPAPIDLPALSLTVKQGAASKSQAIYGGAAWFDERDGQKAQSAAFKPFAPRNFILRVTGLQEPGEYTGQLRLTFADAPPIEQPVTVLVKDSWWWAALWILLGFLLSYALRLAFKVARPRVGRELRIARLRETVTRWSAVPNIGTPEQSLLARVRELVERLSDRLDVSAAAATIDAEIDEMDRKLTLVADWVNATHTAHASRPPAPAALLKVLADVRDYLQNATPAAADFEEARKKLASFPGGLREALRAAIAEQVKALRDIATERLADPGISPDESATLSRILGLLDVASRRAGADSFEEADARLVEAKAAYTDFLVGHLQRLLDARTPFGFRDAAGDWQALKQQLAERLVAVRQLAGTDLETAVKAYNAVYLVFLRRSIEALRTLAAAEAVRFKGVQATERFGVALDAHDTALGTLLTRLGEAADFKALASVAQVYGETERQIAKQVADGDTQASAMSGGTAAPPPKLGGVFGGAAVSTTGAHLVLVSPLARHDGRPRPGVRALTYRLMMYDLGFMAVLAIVTILSGLKLFWLDDPTWGGASASIGAFLWGLGVQQIAGTSFDMGALAARLQMPGFVDASTKT
jgi:hypothetical protein